MMESSTASAGIPVRIALDSRHDGRITEQADYAGMLYDKSGTLYLRYEQPADDGGTIGTTLRWDGRELRLVRSGAVESVQTFVPGRATAGTYRSPLARLELQTETHYVRAEPGGQAGALPMTWTWAYRLTAGGEDAGQFRIRLTIRKERQ